MRFYSEHRGIDRVDAAAHAGRGSLPGRSERFQRDIERERDANLRALERRQEAREDAWNRQRDWYNK
jgi:hypothetical protein